MPKTETFSSEDIVDITQEMQERHVEAPNSRNGKRISTIIEILVQAVTEAFNGTNPYREIPRAQKNFKDAMAQGELMAKAEATGMGEDIVGAIQERARGI